MSTHPESLTQYAPAITSSAPLPGVSDITHNQHPTQSTNQAIWHMPPTPDSIQASPTWTGFSQSAFTQLSNNLIRTPSSAPSFGSESRVPPTTSAAAKLRSCPFAAPDITDLEKQLHQVRFENTVHCQTIQSLRNQLDLIRGDNGCNSDQLQTRNEQLSTQVRDMQQVCEERDRLKSDLNTLTETHNALLRSHGDQQKQLGDKEAMREECVRRQSQIDTLQGEVKRFQEQIRLSQQAGSVQAYLEMSNGNTKLQKRWTRLEEQNVSMKDEIDQLRRRLSDSERSNNERCTEIERLHSTTEQLTDRNTVMRGFRDQYNALNQKYALLLESQHQTNDKLQWTTHQRDNEKAMKEEFWRRCEGLTTSNHTLATKCHNLTMERQSLATAHQRAEQLLWPLAQQACEVYSFLLDGTGDVSAKNRAQMTDHLAAALEPSTTEALKRWPVPAAKSA